MDNKSKTLTFQRLMFSPFMQNIPSNTATARIVSVQRHRSLSHAYCEPHQPPMAFLQFQENYEVRGKSFISTNSICKEHHCLGDFVLSPSVFHTLCIHIAFSLWACILGLLSLLILKTACSFSPSYDSAMAKFSFLRALWKGNGVNGRLAAWKQDGSPKRWPA